MKSYRTLALKELLSQKVTSILILIAVVLSTMMTTIVGQSIGVLSAMREQQAIAIVELAKNTIAHFLSTKPGKKQYLPNKVRSEVSMDILLYFGGPALIAFLIQFLVGCRTQHKILRYIPIYCFVITLAFAIIALTSDSGFFLGGNVIAALVWCIIGVCFLIGYALAIFIYKHRK